MRDGIGEAHPDERRSIRFGVASNPEFLREGTAVDDSLYPDRIVVGASEAQTLHTMQDLYGPLVLQNFDPPPGLPRPPGLRCGC